jgi:hypothetical protein
LWGFQGEFVRLVSGYAKSARPHCLRIKVQLASGLGVLALSNNPAGTLIIFSFNGVLAWIFDPHTEQKPRYRGFVETVVVSVCQLVSSHNTKSTPPSPTPINFSSNTSSTLPTIILTSLEEQNITKSTKPTIKKTRETNIFPNNILTTM